jgi:cytochrome c biogenesis protein CcmG/thiol:disulfide interchange protein DsbE
MTNLFTRLLGLLTIVSAITGVSSAQAELRIGKPAPTAVLVTLDGKMISTRQLKGNTVIVTFWATWCEPCRKELPILSRYVAAHRNQGLRVLAFSLDDEDNFEQVRSMAKGLGFPVGLVNQSDVRGYGRIWHIPVSFVIDSAGLLRYDGSKVTRPAWTQAKLDREVTPLLSTPEGAASSPAH